MAADEPVIGGSGMDPGASPEVGRNVGRVRVNSKAAIDASAFKELNKEFKTLEGHISKFRTSLPQLVKDTKEWASALRSAANSMGKLSGGAGNGGSYIPSPGGNIASGNQTQQQQIANVTINQGLSGGVGGVGAAGKAGPYLAAAGEALGALGQGLENRIARGASYSLAADRMSMVYQQMSGRSQNQVFQQYRQPLQQYRLGYGGINDVLALQASTGINAGMQAKSAEAIRAASGYAYSTADVNQMTRQMASPEAANMMFMTMGTGMYGIAGQQRSTQQVMQDIIRRTGLTNQAAVTGAFQMGSTTRARLAMHGVSEDMIEPLLQMAQQNVAYQSKGGKGFYDPSNKAMRKFMGVEGNYASQAEETERVKANREENFYKRQADNFAQMERNIQAVNKALGAFEEKLSGLIGARVSTKSNMLKGALKFGVAGAIGAAGAALSPFTGGASLMAGMAIAGSTKGMLDAAFGDGIRKGTHIGDGPSSSTGSGGSSSSGGKTPENIRKSQVALSKLNPRFAERVKSMMMANPKLTIGGGTRSYTEQKNLFLSRYVPTDEKTNIQWDGKYWKKKSPTLPDALPPGLSMHEIGLAADMQPKEEFDWIVKHSQEFGLINFANVNNEPWHVQPEEFKYAQFEYKKMGAPWGLNGADASSDSSKTVVNGMTGQALSNYVATVDHSGAAGGASGGSSGGQFWSGMQMGEIIGSSAKGDGVYPSTNSSVGVASAPKLSSIAPVSMASTSTSVTSSPVYQVTIAPNITVQSSGNTSIDAHKLAREVSNLVDKEFRLNLLRST